MARAGLELVVVQMIGRWGSSAIMRYVQNVHLAKQPAVATSIAKAFFLVDAQALARTVGDTTSRPSSVGLAEALRVKLGELSGTLIANIGIIEDRLARLERVTCENSIQKPAVRRSEHTKIHRVSLGLHDNVPMKEYTSVCGWRFGGAPFQLLEVPTTGQFCMRCFPQASARADSSSSVSSGTE